MLKPSEQTPLTTLKFAELVADLNGWYPAASAYRPVVPERLMDTRADTQVGYAGDKPIADQIIELHVTGGTVPGAAGAVTLNITGTDATADGYVTVWPCGSSRPTASNLNLVAAGTGISVVPARVMRYSDTASTPGVSSFFSRTLANVPRIITSWLPRRDP